MWRHKDWYPIEIAMGVEGRMFRGVSELDVALIEAGADAMHQADIEWLKKHTISKPTDRFKVISIPEEEWRDFTKEAESETKRD